MARRRLVLPPCPDCIKAKKLARAAASDLSKGNVKGAATNIASSASSAARAVTYKAGRMAATFKSTGRR